MKHENTAFAIQYKTLSQGDLKPDVLDSLDRRQTVTQSWRQQHGEWILTDNPHVINWDEAKKRDIATSNLTQIIASGGIVCGAYDREKLIGFSAVDGRFLYGGHILELVFCHVTRECRGKGIGRRLFGLAADAAREHGASKLVLSANSSRETQEFYRVMGCRRMENGDMRQFEPKPGDIRMFYAIPNE